MMRVSSSRCGVFGRMRKGSWCCEAAAERARCVWVLVRMVVRALVRRLERQGVV